tara:strand:+ start:8887 stop:11250 length:2364 start_codon:yes stop_codon:yes gene_type:complete
MRHLLLLLNLISFLGFSQNFKEKNYNIKRTNTPPSIDGNVESFWNNIESGGEFICESPENGKNENPNLKTEWKATYDDKAVYFLVLMYDNNPDSILKQLSQRDGLYSANADKIELRINPYNDGQVDYTFSLSAAGVQQDVKYTADGSSEYNWNMVWSSATSITDFGWIAEIKLPYSALRFPKKEVQEWSFNVIRNIRRNRESYSWNYIDNSKSNIIEQAGKISGFKDIDPPVRLTLYPYTSGLAVNKDDTTLFNINGGLDVKYGINQSYTLDMTLIPDFGQVGFDNQVLNLSPFEIQYDEKRSFFNEGTELFDKGGLFYSRRISDNLLNATKITGKNNGNLGVGLLNAITKNTEDTEDMAQSNYNVIVLDQAIKNNSSITFTNTNVQRKNNEGREANVSGLLLNLKDKSNTFSVRSKFNLSQVKENDQNTNGYTSYLELSKNAGKFQYGASNYIENDTYDPNDLGILYNNNEISYSAFASYRILTPTKLFVNFYNNLEVEYEQLFKPREFVTFSIDYNQRHTFKNYLTWGFRTNYNPVNTNDFFEARSGLDNVFIRSKNISGRTFFSSDYRKRIALDVSFGGKLESLYESKETAFRLSPRFRVNDKLFIKYIFSTEKTSKNFGYHQLLKHNNNSDLDISVFAVRDLRFFTNVLESQFVINNKMSFDIKFRHHWQTVDNQSFHEINKEGFKEYGELRYDQENYRNDDGYNNDINYDTSFNAWNIDLNFNYWFAPGSEISIVWKNSILSNGDKLETYFVDNLSGLLENPQENSISLKLRYYLDYQTLRN